MDTSKQFPLMSLPVEVRVGVLKNLLCQNEPIRSCQNPTSIQEREGAHVTWGFDALNPSELNTSILRVNRLLNAEASEIFYEENTFVVTIIISLDWCDVYTWPTVEAHALARLHPETNLPLSGFKRMRNIEVEILADPEFRLDGHEGLRLSTEKLSVIQRYFVPEHRRLSSLKITWRGTDNADPSLIQARSLLHSFGSMRADKVEFVTAARDGLRDIELLITSHTLPFRMVDRVEDLSQYFSDLSIDRLYAIFRQAILSWDARTLKAERREFLEGHLHERTMALQEIQAKINDLQNAVANNDAAFGQAGANFSDSDSSDSGDDE